MPNLANSAVSLVIPTYRRPEALRQALHAVAEQDLAERLQVLVVDDGAPSPAASVTEAEWPFELRYLAEAHAGATRARNRGADAARGALLIFMDDDILLDPGALDRLVETARREGPGTIVLGRLIDLPPDAPRQDPSRRDVQVSVGADENRLDALAGVDCMTGLLAVWREDFSALGGFQDPTGGWPNWDDVDFGHRARQVGLRILRDNAAMAEHRDRSAGDLDHAARRWHAASQAAAWLFQRHPDLLDALPMYADKHPIDWRGDPGRLVLRKLLRRGSTARPVMRGLRRLQRLAPAGRVRRALERWLLGAWMARGLREGRAELSAVSRPTGSGQVPEAGRPRRSREPALMADALPPIGVVLVSWNTRDLLASAIRSVRAHAEAEGLSCRVYVIDNASTDGSADMVERDFPDALLLRNRENLGFGRANNQAFEMSGEAFLLLLNTDAEPEAGALTAMLDTFARHPRCGIVGARLVYPDGLFQASYARFPTLTEELLLLAGLAGLRYGPSHPSAPESESDLPRSVDWVGGACMMLSRDAIRAVGGFDPDFHMYAEETDLCLRVRRAGFEVRYSPDAVAVHHGGRSTQQRIDEQPLLLWRSRLHYFTKHHGDWEARMLALSIRAAYALRRVAWMLRSRLASGPDRERWQGRAASARRVVRELGG